MADVIWYQLRQLCQSAKKQVVHAPRSLLLEASGPDRISLIPAPGISLNHEELTVTGRDIPSAPFGFFFISLFSLSTRMTGNPTAGLLQSLFLSLW